MLALDLIKTSSLILVAPPVRVTQPHLIISSSLGPRKPGHRFLRKPMISLVGKLPWLAASEFLLRVDQNSKASDVKMITRVKQ